MSIRFSYKIIIRKDRMTPQGLAPVRLRITINRTVRYYNLHINVNPDYFDQKNQRIKGNSEESIRWNFLIGETIRKVELYRFECLKEEKNPSFEDFTIFFEGKRLRDKQSLFDFMEHYVQINKFKYSKETLRTYTTQITKLKKFRPVIRFSDINERFIKEYERYMIETLGNKINTYSKSLAFLKSVCNLAINEGIIIKNPFQGYKLKRMPGEREILSEDELKRLIYIFYSPQEFTITKNEHYTLFYFLFACFTGLRFSDMKRLSNQHIIDDNRIELYQGKTKYKVVVPLSKHAKELLHLIEDRKKIHPSVPIFKMFTNQSTNRMLKRLAVLAGIKKNITFHVARHTFATLSISLDIPLYAIKDMLGHRDIRTTQIYAKITEQKRSTEIEKWNKF